MNNFRVNGRNWGAKLPIERNVRSQRITETTEAK
jgi:hypothetical protein